FLSDLDGDKVSELAVTASCEDRIRIYLLRSTDFKLIGRIEGDPDWTGFGSSMAGLPPAIALKEGELLPAMFVVGAERFSGSDDQECGAVLVYKPESFLLQEEPESGLRIYLDIPSPETEPVFAESEQPEPHVAKASEFSGLLIFRYLSGLKSGKLPLNALPSLELALIQQSPIVAMDYDDPNMLSRWVQKNWSRSASRMSEAWGFSFRVQILANGNLNEKDLECNP
ncbi:MAG: hypothetical protein KJ645_09830, partial [Planctomycetes bacterium]|nr:hypothetical protein [Planctomycetota bacterium]